MLNNYISKHVTSNIMTQYFVSPKTNLQTNSNSIKNKSFYYKLRKYLRDYTEVATIHGFRYIAEKRSRAEKSLWALLVLLAFAGCAYMISIIVSKYQTSPVVISSAARDTPIYEIPFPAVTICPESKSSKEEFNYTDAYIKIIKQNQTSSEEELKNFSYLSLLCDEDEEEIFIDAFNKTVDDDFFDVISTLKPTFQMVCEFRGELYEADDTCSEIFSPIITDEGICYTFNMIGRKALLRSSVDHYTGLNNTDVNSKNVDFENGFAENTGTDTYPRRALLSGADNSLDIYFFTLKADNDFICNKFFQGIRVAIHNPTDVPRLSKYYFRIPTEQAVVAAVDPEYITTSEGVKKFDPETRQCYMINERSLQYFQIYSQSNCLLECLTNYTLNKCNCVQFFMPRNNLTAICGVGSFECIQDANDELNKLMMQNKFFKMSNGISKDYCDCKPSCSALRYNAEISQSHFYWKEFFAVNTKINSRSKEENYDQVTASALSIYFKSEQFMTMERKELYGISDFISNFGGLLGLFTGFSLISLVELIYFFSIRIYYNYKLYGQWTGPSASDHDSGV